MRPLLEARGLVKRLGGRAVVNGVDLVCHAGQVLGLLGPNGAGKTTTLRMLSGFVSATYFPLAHPVVAALSTVNPLYHLAGGLRGLLLGAGAAEHLLALAALVAIMLAVLVPLDMRLLRRRVLGD